MQPVTPMMGAFGAVAMLVLTAGVFCWLLTALRCAVGWRLLPPGSMPAALDVLKALNASPAPPLIDWRARRPVPWGVLDLVAILVIFALLAIGIGVSVRQWTGLTAGTEMESLTLGQRQWLTIANMAVSLLTLAICLPLMLLRPATRWRDFGWSWTTLGRDVRLGLVGFVMLAPPVYAIQGILVYFWKPSAHPLMEMFKGTPNAAFFATLIAAAVIVAPLVEEMLFRVFLQGFLEKVSSVVQGWLKNSDRFGEELHELLVVRFWRPDTASPTAIFAEPIVAQLAATSPDSNPIAQRLGTTEAALEAIVSDDQPELRGLWAWIPIGISSIIFALLHYSHGPDWVPLTLLAAGMGYLYQRTHSVIPSLTVHMCLNGLSMWGLWIQVYELPVAK